MCGDGIRKTKTYLALSLLRDMKDNKKGVYREISC